MSAGLPQPGAPNFLAKIREFALVGAGLLGDKNDAFVTVGDLLDAGIATARPSFIARGTGQKLDGPGAQVQPVYVVDLTPPPMPTGFSATSGTTNILFKTDPATYTQGNGHAKTIVFAANYSGTGPLPTFSDAVEYAAFTGNIDTAAFDPASNLHLWVEWESKDGVRSPPAGGTNGYTASTGLVDDAMIGSLSAGKILAGSIAVGQYIQSADYVAGVSGWRIATLIGGGAFVEIRGNAVFGGTIYATAGNIGGSQIASDYIRSATYALGSAGWILRADGTGQLGGFVVNADGIQSQNYIAGVQGWNLKYDGTGQLRLATLDAISANLGTITAGVLKNSTDSVHFDLNATGSSLMLRAGASTNYGPYAGTHYKVEINADGSAIFGRDVMSGGTVKAYGGSYAIPIADRPAVYWHTNTGWTSGDGP